MTFEEYVRSQLNTPFVWGEHDCILFSIGWLNHRTGKDWLAELPKWRTAKQALRTIQSVGGLEYQFDLNLERINPNLARDGDIGLLGHVTFLFSGSYVLAPGYSGLEFIERTKVPCAWSF
jgi:hypothetical protein